MKVVKSSIVFKSSCLCCFPSIHFNPSCKEIGCFQISSGDKMDQINDVRNPTKPIIGAELLPVSQRPSSNSYGDYMLSTGLQLSMQGHRIQEKHITQSDMAVVYYQHVYSCQCKVTEYRRNIKPQPLWPLCINNKLTAVDSKPLNSKQAPN